MLLICQVLNKYYYEVLFELLVSDNLSKKKKRHLQMLPKFGIVWLVMIFYHVIFFVITDLKMFS